MYAWKAVQKFISTDPGTPEIKNNITNSQYTTYCWIIFNVL